MAEPYSLSAAQDFDRATPGALDLGQTVRSMQVDQFDVLDAGSVPCAVLNFDIEPTAGDTVTIGADVYEFQAALGSVTLDSNIGVELSGAAATTLVNLRDAINAQDADGLHDSIKLIDHITPAKANGTEPVVASLLSASQMLVKGAASAGGAVSVGPVSLVLGESMTPVPNVWDCGNVNMNTLGAKAEGQLQMGKASYTVANASAGVVRAFSFPFAVDSFVPHVRTSSGGERQTDGNDTFVISGNEVILTLAGGAAPDIQNTDVVTVIALG